MITINQLTIRQAAARKMAERLRQEETLQVLAIIFSPKNCIKKFDTLY